MTTETTINDILNFIIPIGVWVFIGWIIYRIPIVNEGIKKGIEWIKNKKEGREEKGETTTLRSIGYE